MQSLINATFWSSIQRFGGLAIGFVSNIVLARLLCPEDYGVVALIMVFVGIADVLVDGGLGNALIQKKSIDEKDISTVFTINMIVSIILFIILFLTAPFIGSIVSVERFSLFLRVEAIMVLVRALYVVHFSLINRNMEFQKLAKINLCASFLTTIIAIVLAYMGMGVWSLIIKNIVLDLISCMLYFIFAKTKLRLHIHKESFKQLFEFGFFVAITNIVESLYSNILSFILGKKFSVKDLGYYNQAYSLEQVPVYSMTMVLNQVIFPYLSKEQDKKNKMVEDMKKSISIMSFFIYPLMTFLIFFAEPVIVLLYSEKWLPAVPFFQILCTIGFTNFIYHLNRNALKAVGETRTLFYSQIVVCFWGLLFVFISIPVGIYAVVVMVAINSIIGFCLVALFTGKHVDLSLLNQIKEVMANFLISFVAGAVSFIILKDSQFNVIIQLLAAIAIFSATYFLLHYLFKSKPYLMVTNVVINHINKTT